MCWAVGGRDGYAKGWVGLTVCRSKKEDWLPKKDRNQRRPGRRRSQEDFGGIW